ncbi:31 kDa immunogenic protein [Actinoplanes sp. SE50]|uniref:TAXI family TRAP transporter solute-binding subunit n=1 Tax=unclassified Actinoplanes TaxID=2626549 RepID=UPI00023EBDEA|nr:MULTISPECIES: TAXI family TRAP transporter solute-binding subunit [unclassified Actinoplanes]AEV86904.1 31 kDa immunogenic protein [Actinoplanes sp. SE50/110]ATO85301.1 31 kDa immunogenic protein [Actinoplanes sp. SE50]SLM02711.1 hypothetical protein ACSP50_5993 [Actinoplanes sp. SE50/110]
MKRRDLGRLALGSALLAAGCSGSSAEADELVIATGSVGGVYDRLGTALASVGQRFALQMSAVRTAASIENMTLLGNRAADIGFTTVDCASLALGGEAPFPAPVPIAALAALYDDYLQLVVRADASIGTLADLAGRRVSTGEVGSGTDIAAERVLAAAGLAGRVRIARQSLSTAVAGVRAGALDAFFFSAGLPTPAINDLVRAEPGIIRLLPLSQLVGRLQSEFGEVYAERTVPRVTYRMTADVGTIGITNVLVVRRDMSDNVARRLTALLFEAGFQLRDAHIDAEQIDPRSALGTYPVPLHPGAQQYYRAAKLFVD